MIRALTGLLILLMAAMILAVGIGAVSISPAQSASILLHQVGLPIWTAFEEQQEAVLMSIRLPRVLLGALVGAGLSASGAALQGLYRNPLADPGLLGISGGASLAAAATIVLGIHWFGLFTLPIAAFTGSLLAMSFIYGLSRQGGKTEMTTLLLAGIAISSLCGSGTGLFTYLSTDEEMRTITFWQLGSLGGATWSAVAMASPFILASLTLIFFCAKPLNALLLGEANAQHLGISVERIKWLLVVLVAFGVGASVAVSGMIGFVGLVVPHLVRLWKGPNHLFLIPASALLGSTLLVLADLLSRTIVSPAELPIGIVTALSGSPFFLYLLLKEKRRVRL